MSGCSSCRAMATSDAVHASGATAAGRPSWSTFSGNDPAAVRCSPSQPSSASALSRCPVAAQAAAKSAVSGVQLMPSFFHARRAQAHRPAGSSTPARGRCAPSTSPSARVGPMGATRKVTAASAAEPPRRRGYPAAPKCVRTWAARTSAAAPRPVGERHLPDERQHLARAAQPRQHRSRGAQGQRVLDELPVVRRRPGATTSSRRSRRAVGGSCARAWGRSGAEQLDGALRGGPGELAGAPQRPSRSRRAGRPGRRARGRCRCRSEPRSRRRPPAPRAGNPAAPPRARGARTARGPTRRTTRPAARRTATGPSTPRRDTLSPTDSARRSSSAESNRSSPPSSAARTHGARGPSHPCSLLDEQRALRPGREHPRPGHHGIRPPGGHQLALPGRGERHRLAVQGHLDPHGCGAAPPRRRPPPRPAPHPAEERPAARDGGRGHDRTVCRGAAGRPEHS